MKNVRWLNGPIDKKWKELSKSDVLVHFAAVGVNEKFANLESCFNFNVTKSTNLIFNAIQANCLKWMIISSSYEQKVKSLRYIHKTLKDKTRTPHFNYAFTKGLFSKICLSLSNKNNILNSNFDFIYGHFQYSISNYFPNRLSITTFRNPVERCISHYNMIMEKNQLLSWPKVHYVH